MRRPRLRRRATGLGARRVEADRVARADRLEVGAAALRRCRSGHALLTATASFGASGALSTSSSWPSSTDSPATTSTLRTTPALSASTSCSIFIASSTSSGAPAATGSLHACATETTTPANGALTVSCSPSSRRDHCAARRESRCRSQRANVRKLLGCRLRRADARSRAAISITSMASTDVGRTASERREAAEGAARAGQGAARAAPSSRRRERPSCSAPATRTPS